MTTDRLTVTGGRIFDGIHLHTDKAAHFKDGVFIGLKSIAAGKPQGRIIDLEGGFLAPGYVDLQVNGGGGVMFNDKPSVTSLSQIAQAHRRLGTTSILPTLITDTKEKTCAAIEAARSAIKANIPGIAGLHLEGPHLSVARKGAHDAALIRPMEQSDLALLLEAKKDIPVLKVTVAPESVSLEFVAKLTEAGILVSLGHSDADFETCCAYAEAGARCVTHLFNAMSQLGNREPGLVGAALACGTLSAGLIADAIHVHPSTIRFARSAKTGPGRIFLVSDAMAVAGTQQTEFHLGDRRISRKDGRLTLESGTLAGADLDLTTAVRVMVEQVGAEVESALQAATSVPANVIGQPCGLFSGVSSLSDLNWITSNLADLTPLADSRELKSQNRVV